MLQQLPQLLFSGAIEAFEGGRALPEPEVGKPDLKQEISHLVWYVRGGTKNNHNKQGLRRRGEGRGVPGVLVGDTSMHKYHGQRTNVSACPAQWNIGSRTSPPPFRPASAYAIKRAIFARYLSRCGYIRFVWWLFVCPYIYRIFVSASPPVAADHSSP